MRSTEGRKAMLNEWRKWAYSMNLDQRVVSVSHTGLESSDWKHLKVKEAGDLLIEREDAGYLPWNRLVLEKLAGDTLLCDVERLFTVAGATLVNLVLDTTLVQIVSSVSETVALLNRTCPILQELLIFYNSNSRMPVHLQPPLIGLPSLRFFAFRDASRRPTEPRLVSQLGSKRCVYVNLNLRSETSAREFQSQVESLKS